MAAKLLSSRAIFSMQINFTIKMIRCVRVHISYLSCAFYRCYTFFILRLCAFIFLKLKITINYEIPGKVFPY